MATPGGRELLGLSNRIDTLSTRNQPVVRNGTGRERQNIRP